MQEFEEPGSSRGKLQSAPREGGWHHVSDARIPGLGDTTDFDRKRRRRLSISPAVGRRSRPILETLETRQLLSTYVVTNTADNLPGLDPQPGEGTGTLRQAIVDADASSSPANIVFNIPASTAPLLMSRFPASIQSRRPGGSRCSVRCHRSPTQSRLTAIPSCTMAACRFVIQAGGDLVYIQSVPNTSRRQAGE